MTNLGVLLADALPRLEAEGIESARLDAQLLLAHVMGKDRTYVMGYPEHEVEDSVATQFQALLDRRIAREPIAYITGIKEFWGLEFNVVPGVLIPRPDSETLVEAVLKEIPNKNQPLNMLDVGTGSGCLLLSLLHEYPNATGVGADVSEVALGLAKANAAKLNLANRADFVLTDIKKVLLEKMTGVDVLISNPPYIRDSDIDSLQPEVSGYEPRLALEGGADGLSFYRVMANYITTKRLQPVLIALEIGQGQEQEVQAMFAHTSYTAHQHTDLAGIVRVITFIKH